MLLLTRKIGQSIIINDNIEIFVKIIRGLHVQLGIEAPKEIEVHRREIWERIQEEKRLEGEQQITMQNNNNSPKIIAALDAAIERTERIIILQQQAISEATLELGETASSSEIFLKAKEIYKMRCK